MSLVEKIADAIEAHKSGRTAALLRIEERLKGLDGDVISIQWQDGNRIDKATHGEWVLNSGYALKDAYFPRLLNLVQLMEEETPWRVSMKDGELIGVGSKPGITML